MKASSLTSLAAWEARQAVRSRWVIATAGVFAAVCVMVTFFGLKSLRSLGLAGATPLSDALIAVGVLLPPLLGLLLGSATIAGPRERGLLALLAAQPMKRARLSLGAFFGASIALVATVLFGLGSAVVVLSGVTRGSDLLPLLGVLGATIGAGLAATSIGVGISALSRSRLQAAATAVSAWFLLAFGIDLLLVGIVPGMGLGPAGMLVAVLINPLEAARMLALLIASPDGGGLGPFGQYLVGELGLGGSLSVFVGGIGFWVAVPLAVAGRALRRLEL